ncbi:MAG: molecular chaperone TorD, partial [Proteobacteria bacterium]|nr:molecular chaperone TorD [Pseudomonadota bacterium]
AQNILTDAMMEKIRYGLENTGADQKSVDVLRGYQKGLWDLFEKTFAISWIVDKEDANEATPVAEDVAVVIAAFPQLLRKCVVDTDILVSYFVHQGKIFGGKKARDSWRVVFAEALLRWNEQKEKTL